MTIRCVFCLALSLLFVGYFMPNLRAESGRSAPEPVIEWHLPADLSCLIRSDCAVFMPADRSPIVRQSAWASVSKKGAGELCLYSQGHFVLEARRGNSRQTLVLRGPSCYFLDAHRVILFSSGQGRYRHGEAGSDAADVFELAVPPLVAGPRGTEFQYVLAPDGQLGIQVLNGEVSVHWLGAPLDATLTLQAGDALFLDDASVQQRSAHRESGLQARQRFEALTRLKPPVTKAGEGPPLDFAGFGPYLRSADSQELLRQAQAFARRHPGQEVGARVLYFAWLKTLTLGESTAAESLRTQAQEAYPDSPWTRLMQAPANTAGAP